MELVKPKRKSKSVKEKAKKKYEPYVSEELVEEEFWTPPPPNSHCEIRLPDFSVVMRRSCEDNLDLYSRAFLRNHIETVEKAQTDQDLEAIQNPDVETKTAIQRAICVNGLQEHLVDFRKRQYLCRICHKSFDSLSACKKHIAQNGHSYSHLRLSRLSSNFSDRDQWSDPSQDLDSDDVLEISIENWRKVLEELKKQLQRQQMRTEESAQMKATEFYRETPDIDVEQTTPKEVNNGTENNSSSDSSSDQFDDSMKETSNEMAQLDSVHLENSYSTYLTKEPTKITENITLKEVAPLETSNLESNNNKIPEDSSVKSSNDTIEESKKEQTKVRQPEENTDNCPVHNLETNDVITTTNPENEGAGCHDKMQTNCNETSKVYVDLKDNEYCCENCGKKFSTLSKVKSHFYTNGQDTLEDNHALQLESDVSNCITDSEKQTVDVEQCGKDSEELEKTVETEKSLPLDINIPCLPESTESSTVKTLPLEEEKTLENSSTQKNFSDNSRFANTSSEKMSPSDDEKPPTSEDSSTDKTPPSEEKKAPEKSSADKSVPLYFQFSKISSADDSKTPLIESNVSKETKLPLKNSKDLKKWKKSSKRKRFFHSIKTVIIMTIVIIFG